MTAGYHFVWKSDVKADLVEVLLQSRSVWICQNMAFGHFLYLRGQADTERREVYFYRRTDGILVTWYPPELR